MRSRRVAFGAIAVVAAVAAAAGVLWAPLVTAPVEPGATAPLDGVDVVCLLAATSIAACSGPLDRAPKPVRDALEPFLKAGYACAGPSSDHSAFTQWQCDRQASNGVHAYVVLDGEDAAIKQVTATIDQSDAGAIQRDVVSTFFKDVAAINVAGSATAVQDWVGAHMAAGGQEQVGPVLITLDSLRTVDHLVIFATG